MVAIKIKSLRGLGWSPELPSTKDWPFEKRRNAKLPPFSADRRALEENPPVRDQGNEGSCVGMSATYAVGFLRRTDRDKYSTVYSAQQMYYDARVADGVEWKDVDSGAYIRDAMDSLRKKGVAQESNWPYKRAFNRTPSPTAYREARRWKLGAHYRCNSLDDVLHAINENYAVVGGISVFSSMLTKQVDRSGVVPMPKKKDTLEGGHALYFDMFDQRKKQIRFQNSWGTGWGDDGYGYLPFGYLEDFGELADDFWAMQVESPDTTPWRD